jgi:DNA polymerase
MVGMAQTELDMVAQEVRGCTLCALHSGRVRAVPGEGPANAKVMFIGEGPGFHEDRQGRPFVGASGQFLDELLARANMRREDVFITNVVKCRPPNNRDPVADEIDTCTGTYLDRQIAAINPSVIVTLGRFSMHYFLPNERIMRVHGQPRTVKGRLVVPMIHPAAALHQPQNRPLLEADFEQLPVLLQRAEQLMDPSNQPPDEQAEQLSLF